MYDNLEHLTEDEFLHRLKTLPNDRGLRLDKRMSDELMRCRHLDPEVMEEWNDDQTRFNIVCPMFRAEIIHPFGMYLEHVHFDPNDVKLNDQFWQAWYTWNDIPWNIISIPVEKANLAYNAAANTNTRLADGIPRLICGEESIVGLRPSQYVRIHGVAALTFPLNRDNTFGLEPQYPDRGPHFAGIAIVPKAAPPPEPNWMDDFLKRHKQKKKGRK